MENNMERYILDELDKKEKEFIEENGEAPSMVILDLYSYMELAKELGKDLVEEEYKYLHGCYKIIVDDIAEEEFIRFVS